MTLMMSMLPWMNVISSQAIQRFASTYLQSFSLVACNYSNIDQFVCVTASRRWDESAVSIIPEYLRKFYLRLIGSLKDIEAVLEPKEKYLVVYYRRVVRMDISVINH